jgi:hypothetical protein
MGGFIEERYLKNDKLNKKTVSAQNSSVSSCIYTFILRLRSVSILYLFCTHFVYIFILNMRNSPAVKFSISGSAVDSYSQRRRGGSVINIISLLVSVRNMDSQ